ncbi:MAG: Ig-like domain-containing protein, partial [Candidatus Methanomethyliaceae archaeon]
GGKSDTGTLVVGHGSLDHVALSPKTATIPAGSSQSYTLTAYDPYGNSWDVTSSATFTITPSAGGSWSGNTYTSEKAGTWTVTGSYGGKSDTGTLVVLPMVISSVSITPSLLSLHLPEQTSGTFTVIVLDAYTNPVPGATVSLETTFGQLSSQTVVTGSTGTATFAITSTTSGTAHITARVGTASGQAICTWISADLVIQFNLPVSLPHVAIFTVKFFQPGTSTLLYTYTVTALSTAGSFSIPNIPQGSYDIWVKEYQAISVKFLNISFPQSGTVVKNCGTLYLGDINNDDKVNIYDFSILAGCYGKQAIDPGFDPRADLNHDGRISIYDFSILAGNYGCTGPMTRS